MARGPNRGYSGEPTQRIQLDARPHAPSALLNKPAPAVTMTSSTAACSLRGRPVVLKFWAGGVPDTFFIDARGTVRFSGGGLTADVLDQQLRQLLAEN